MAMNNRDRVGKAFDLLSEGLLDEVDEFFQLAQIHAISPYWTTPCRGDRRRSGFSLPRPGADLSVGGLGPCWAVRVV